MRAVAAALVHTVILVVALAVQVAAALVITTQMVDLQQVTRVAEAVALELNQQPIDFLARVDLDCALFVTRDRRWVVSEQDKGY
jgi:hypothetical protein